MDNFLRRSWAEINLDHLEENYRIIQSLIPETTKVMAVLKADAYGCGDADCAAALEKFSGDWYCVSNFHEAMSLRDVGSKKEILILAYTPPDYAPLLIEHDITQTAISLDHAKKLAAAAESAGKPVKIHIKLDTGMNRIGLVCYGEHTEAAIRDAEWILNNRWLQVTGIFSHPATLYELDEVSAAYARNQFQSFLAVTEALQAKGYDLGVRHCCNSAGIINMPELATLDAVRAGTVLFGVVPEACKRRPVQFQEVLSIKSTVCLVKDVKKGEFLSYSMSGYAKENIRAAVLPIGYADGYRRGLSNIGRVLIGGVSCPILGRVCMDQIIVDVSEAGDVRLGAEAVLLGKQGNLQIKTEELSRPLQTGPSEVITLLTKRLPRVYLRGGKPSHYVTFRRQATPI